MFAPILSVPLGRLVTHGDLYAVTFNPVARPRDVVAPDQVQIDQVSDDSLYVHGVGACFVGPALAQRGA
jgi:hypothetical protein